MAPPARKLYDQIATSDETTEDDALILQNATCRTRLQPLLRSAPLTLAFVATAVLAGFIFSACISVAALIKSTQDTLEPPQVLIQKCGETPAQARASSCVFDVMLQSWVPSDCYYEELSEKYLATYRWKWFYDKHAEKEMPDEVMRLGEHNSAFMVDNFHRRHCMYTWEITTLALKGKRPLLDAFLSPSHVGHCNKVLSAPAWEWNETTRLLGVEAHRGFGECAPYSAWVLEL